MMLSKTRKPGEGPRPRTDFYPTPAGAVHAFMETGELDGYNNLWEPACGDGALWCAIAEYDNRDLKGCKCLCTDLNDHGFGESGVDFLMEQKLLAPAIVTNPPYNLATDFVEKALDLEAEYIAMILPINFLGAKKRKRCIEKLSRLYVFENRVSMFPKDFVGEKKTTTIIYGWFVWDKSHKGPTILGKRLIYKP